MHSSSVQIIYYAYQTVRANYKISKSHPFEFWKKITIILFFKIESLRFFLTFKHNDMILIHSKQLFKRSFNKTYD